MKITQIDAIVLDTSSDRRPILARVTTDTGIYGYGETSVGFCAGAPAAQAMILEMGKYVLGMNPLHHEKIWSTMYDNSFWACGGITEGKKICDLASAYDISVQTHVCGSPIATTASLHMEAAIPNFVIREWHVQNRFPSFRLFQKYDYSPVNGYCPVPELPGIGQELSDYALAHCDAKTIRL